MEKKTVRTIEERRALCKAKYELMDNMPTTRKLMSFEEWIDGRYRYYLSLEEYNSEDTPKERKYEADDAYNAYRMETEAYNDLLDDMYTLLS